MTTRDEITTGLAEILEEVAGVRGPEPEDRRRRGFLHRKGFRVTLAARASGSSLTLASRERSSV